MDNTLSGELVVELPGPILLGGFLQSFLSGILILQALNYWADCRDDSLRKRFFVTVVTFLCVLQTAVEIYKSWRTAIGQKKWSTSRIQWLDLFLNGLISSLCEAFFIRRCWKMTKKSPWVLYPLSTLVASIMAANSYLAIAMAIAFETLEAGITYESLSASRGILVSTVVTFSYWIFGSLVIDVILASILIICLWKSKTGLKELDQVVMYIIKITLESAALPSICMIIAVGLYHTSPHLKDHLILFFVLLTGKLYTIGMFHMLNSRAKLRQQMKTHVTGRTSLGEWQWEAAKKPSSFSSTNGEPIGPSEPPRALDATSTVRSSVTSLAPLTSSRCSLPDGFPAEVISVVGEPGVIAMEIRTP